MVHYTDDVYAVKSAHGVPGANTEPFVIYGFSPSAPPEVFTVE